MVPHDETYARSELVADVRHLAEQLETAHPDPYDGHGGRVDFHRRVEEAVRAIPDAGEPLHEFYPRVAELVAGVRDGHTDISPPDDSAIDGELPLGLRVVGDELYVDEVYADAHAELLGGRVVSVSHRLYWPVDSIPLCYGRHTASLRAVQHVRPRSVPSSGSGRQRQRDRREQLLGLAAVDGAGRQRDGDVDAEADRRDHGERDQVAL